MTKGTLTVGGILTLTGIVAYIVSGAASATALIPAGFGVVFLILGLIARKPRAQSISTHIALVVALLGVAGTVTQVLKLGELFAGTAERPMAIVASSITFVTLVIYLVAGIMSFVRARRSRSAE